MLDILFDAVQMKQSILKKPAQNLNENEHLLIGTLVESVPNEFNQQRSVHTSKNVRFHDIIESMEKCTPLNTSLTNFNHKKPSSAKREDKKPGKKLYNHTRIFKKPENESDIPLVYQNPIKSNSNSSLNLSYNVYQQNQNQDLAKGLKITSASIENRVQSSLNPKKQSIEFSLNKNSSNATPIRTPIQISSLLTATSLSNNEKNTSKNNYYFYFNKLNQTINKKTNETIVNFAKNQYGANILQLKSNPDKFKLKEFNDLSDKIEKLSQSSDSSLNMPSLDNKQSQQQITNTSSTLTSSIGPKDNQKTKLNPSITLYTYLLQNNKSLSANNNIRASIIRSQTKKFNLERENSGLSDDSSSLSLIRRIRIEPRNEPTLGKILTRSSSANSSQMIDIQKIPIRPKTSVFDLNTLVKN